MLRSLVARLAGRAVPAGRRQRNAIVTALVAFTAFGTAAAFGTQVYRAACSHEFTVHRLRRVWAHTAATSAADRLARRAAQGEADALRATLATVDGRAALAAAMIAGAPLAPAVPNERVPANADALALTIRPGVAPAPDLHGGAAAVALPATLGRYAVEVRLLPAFAATLDPVGFAWNRAQLLIAVLSLGAGAVTVLVLQARRERETARVRSEFVAHVSHELRTPLAQIRMAAETLRFGWTRTEDDRQRVVGALDVEARRLAHLVENVLCFSSAERDVLRIARLPVDVTELAHEAVTSFEPRVPAGRSRFQVLAPGPAMVAGDRDALRQLVLNLLDNAVKYGPRGQLVTVRVEARPAAGTHDAVVLLSVEDQGPGVPAASRERVFAPFVREPASDAGNDAATGHGIGLAVVRHVARLHEGTVVVDGAPGGGARFVLSLPATLALVRDGGVVAPDEAYAGDLGVGVRTG